MNPGSRTRKLREDCLHPPLSPGAHQIRLLRILYHQPPIQCTLETYNLAENTKYVALSYTWGNPNDKHTILVNGHGFSVRKNLWNFLIGANRSFPNSLFWIDQICIEQENIEERNDQVLHVQCGRLFSCMVC